MTSANGVSEHPPRSAPNGASTVMPRVPILPFSYDSSDSQGSALRLIHAVRPEWDSPASNVKFVRFTDGITNTLLKAVNDVKGATPEEVDREAILLRAYGNGTHVIIDRQREAENHELLMAHGLAPELLARFENGMLYKFIRGGVTSTDDLRDPVIYTAVARRLAEWHARIPCLPSAPPAASEKNGDCVLSRRRQSIDSAAPGKPAPNMWTVMQKWIFALPTDTEQQRKRQATLQTELNQLVKDLSQRPGLGKNGVSFTLSSPVLRNLVYRDLANVPRSSSLRTVTCSTATLSSSPHKTLPHKTSTSASLTTNMPPLPPPPSTSPTTSPSGPASNATTPASPRAPNAESSSPSTSRRTSPCCPRAVPARISRRKLGG